MNIEEYQERLMCGIDEIRLLVKAKQVYFLLPDGHCVDMSGAIGIAAQLMPDVQAIRTFSGRTEDTAFVIEESGEWGARVMRTSSNEVER